MMNFTLRFLALAVAGATLLSIPQSDRYAPVSSAYASAKEKKDHEDPGKAPIGYEGPRMRMLPIMLPLQSPTGVRYHPIVLQVALGSGPSGPELKTEGGAEDKRACFALPFLHEQFLQYFYNAKLTTADIIGDRKEVLEKNLFDVAVKFVGSGLYTGVEIVGDDAPPLEPRSDTLSKQCR